MRIYSQTSVNVEGDRSYGGGHVIVSMSPTETPVVEKVGDLVHIRAKGGLADHLTLTFRPDDATRSVLRRVLEAMGTELVSKDHTPTPTPPVCDHCGEPVEAQRLGMTWEWAHSGERDEEGTLFYPCANDPQMIAQVDGFRTVPRGE